MSSLVKNMLSVAIYPEKTVRSRQRSVELRWSFSSNRKIELLQLSSLVKKLNPDLKHDQWLFENRPSPVLNGDEIEIMLQICGSLIEIARLPLFAPVKVAFCMSQESGVSCIDNRYEAMLKIPFADDASVYHWKLLLALAECAMVWLRDNRQLDFDSPEAFAAFTAFIQMQLTSPPLLQPMGRAAERNRKVS